MKRFAIHPGYILSPDDGERHYVGPAQLCELYGIRPEETVVAGDRGVRIGIDGLLHLFPSANGGAYWHISELERRQYPIRGEAHSNVAR